MKQSESSIQTCGLAKQDVSHADVREAGHGRLLRLGGSGPGPSTAGGSGGGASSLPGP